MRKLIKPAREGLLVRKADGSRLKPEGEPLPVSGWWYRRQAEGDVVIADIEDKPVAADARPRKTGEK